MDLTTITADNLHTITALDLNEEATEAVANGQPVEHAQYHNEETDLRLEVVYFPEAGRAGVCAGGDSEWTDADSAEDAIDRYEADEMVA